jgi:hypothetical protein
VWAGIKACSPLPYYCSRFCYPFEAGHFFVVFVVKLDSTKQQLNLAIPLLGLKADGLPQLLLNCRRRRGASLHNRSNGE